MEKQEQEETILDKLNFFLISKTKIHLTKKNGTFLNGFIFERLEEKVFLMKEDALGIIHIFVSEVKFLDQFKEKEE